MRVKKVTAGATPPLAREEWDFGACPEGNEYSCWAYEFARECPKIRAAVQAADDNRKAGTARKLDAAVDEDLNWHYEISIYGSDGEVEDVTVLKLPLEHFPHTPYLSIKNPRKRRTPSKKESEFLLNFRLRSFGETGFGPKRLGASSRIILYIDWNAPDDTLRRAFARWLKTHRPFPDKSQRGKSLSKRRFADLRALGAYRLLKTMSVLEAMDFSMAKRGSPLYAKPADWSTAKRRVRQVLRTNFSCV